MESHAQYGARLESERVGTVPANAPNPRYISLADAAWKHPKYPCICILPPEFGVNIYIHKHENSEDLCSTRNKTPYEMSGNSRLLIHGKHLNEIWLYESDPNAPSTCSEPGGQQWQRSIRGRRNWYVELGPCAVIRHLRSVAFVQETKRPQADSHHLKIVLVLEIKSVISGICHFDWVKGIYCFALWNGGEHSWNCYTFRFIAIPFLATVLLYIFTYASAASVLCLMQIFAVSQLSLIDRQVSCFP